MKITEIKKRKKNNRIDQFDKKKHWHLMHILSNEVYGSDDKLR